jgi:nitronate monooxygenase
MQLKSRLAESMQLSFPMIMAPMFLVSNKAMVEAAMKEGILGVFPTLNYRNEGDLESLLKHLNAVKSTQKYGNYGVNIIVQKTNILYQKHLAICVEHKVPFYITSLGSPKEVIEKAHAYGAKVYCDVTNIKHAQKCHDLGCDGFIAVGQGAGGHAGPYPLHILVNSLRKHFPDTPIVAAGGLSSGSGILSMQVLGAEGVSIGTRFIASTEATVSNEYKNAIVDSKMEDIVLSERISGTPCTIINTPYAKKIGYKQGFFEKLLSNNARTKKYFKMLVQYRGMKKLENAIKPGNYQTLWCAGQSVELIDAIQPIQKIVQELKKEYQHSLEEIINQHETVA